MADKTKPAAEKVPLPSNYADILAAAEAAIEGGKGDEWETQFVKEQRERFERWGDQLYLSPKQLDIVKRIAAKAASVVEE